MRRTLLIVIVVCKLATDSGQRGTNVLFALNHISRISIYASETSEYGHWKRVQTMYVVVVLFPIVQWYDVLGVLHTLARVAESRGKCIKSNNVVLSDL